MTPGEGVSTHMTKKDQNASDQNIRQKGAGKKPYNKPEFRYEKVFETMALSCGKIAPAGSCKVNRKFS
jgi:hypothetical protein